MDSSTKILAGVLGGVVLGAVACAAVAGAYLLGALRETPPVPGPQVGQSRPIDSLAVGDCVKQTGADAAAANCAEQQAYRIVKIGTSAMDCPDAGQPYVTVGSKVLCLAPAAR